MEIRKIDNVILEGMAEIKVTTCGNIVELMYSDKVSNGNTIKKLNANEYINVATGEIKEYRHTEHRGQSKNELRKTFKKIRDVINCNVADPWKCRWVTLTYKINMMDSKKLQKDVENYVARVRKKVGHFEYIQVAEPQGRGAWHIHMIMLFSSRAPFIDNKDMAKMWRHGYTDTQKLDDKDNLGAYLSAYLGDIDLDSVQDMDTALAVNGLEVKEVGGKKYIKGGRLHMYPTGFRIFRCSKGVKRPVVERMTEMEAQKKVSSAKLTFEKTIHLLDQENEFENVINYRYYNKMKNGKQ